MYKANHHELKNPSITTYVVCSVPRSGSTLLGTTFARLGLFHSFTAPFNFIELKRWAEGRGDHPFGPADVIPYLNSWLPADWSELTNIGLVVEHSQLCNFLGLLRQATGKRMTELESFKTIFPNLNFIFLQRRNRVRQAISLVRARQTHVLHRHWMGKVRMCIYFAIIKRI